MNPPTSFKRLDIPNPAGDWFTVEALDEHTFSIAEYGQWLKLHCYLVIGREKAALIDTGLGIGSLKALVDQLTTLPIVVISTHGHWDHIGNHREFEEIWIHPAEKEWVEHGYLEDATEIRDFLRQKKPTKSFPPGFDLELHRIGPCTPTRLLSDLQSFDLGGRTLTILHTPGHSPGHVCVYEQATGILATGDLLYHGILLADLSHSDPHSFHESLRRLDRLPGINHLLPGHGRLTITPDLISEAITAFDQLDQQGKLERGAGAHRFERLAIQL